jgi:hypothetical protein
MGDYRKLFGKSPSHFAIGARISLIKVAGSAANAATNASSTLHYLAEV